MKTFCVFLAIFAVASASTSENEAVSQALTFVKNCGENQLVLCLKERALRYIEETNGDVELTEGITFVETEQPADAGRSLDDISLSAEPEQRENEVDALLVERVARFLGTHTLEFKVQKESIQEMQRSLEEGRGKKKKAMKLLLPLLALMKFKAAATLPLIFGFLALIAVKALLIGKLALLISSVIALKKIFGQQESHQSYEVIAHPQPSFDDHHGHYARSFDAQNLAYAAHA